MLELVSLLAIAQGMHTVFSTECTNFFDWQSLGVFYSHQEVVQPGLITRLMACDHPADYAGADIGPTHIHPNFALPKNNHVHDHYLPYNKPWSVFHWLYNSVEPLTAEYILFVEPDTIFRKPIDCHSDLGARPGVVASSPRPFLQGADNGMAAQFVSPEAIGRIDKVGGFICIHIDDLRKVVLPWMNFTVLVRKNPERYWQIDGVGSDYPTGDDYVQRGHAPYISEMYGYIFAAAEVGLRHSIREDVLLTAGDPPLYEPSLLHYDQYCKFGDKHFNKLSYKSGFTAQNCRQYFPRPPDLEELLGQDVQEMGTESICIEQVSVLNEALCEYHKRTCCKWDIADFGCHNMKPWRYGIRTAAGCEKSCCDRGGGCSHFVWDESAPGGPCFHSRFKHGDCAEGSYVLTGGQIAKQKLPHDLQCPTPSWNAVQRFQDEHNLLGGAPNCEDTERSCRDWEAAGECVSNLGYMRLVCPTTCRVEGCWDRHHNCQAWADMGECEENFQYMIETCPVVCRRRRAERAQEERREAEERYQRLREARAELDAEAALEATLQEEAPDPGDEPHATADVAEPEPVVYQAARVVTRPRDAPPRPPPVAPPAPVQVVEEIAWARVVLAAACGLLCLGATCSRLCGWRRHRAVHVLSKTV